MFSAGATPADALPTRSSASCLACYQCICHGSAAQGSAVALGSSACLLRRVFDNSSQRVNLGPPSIEVRGTLSRNQAHRARSAAPLRTPIYMLHISSSAIWYLIFLPVVVSLALGAAIGAVIWKICRSTITASANSVQEPTEKNQDDNKSEETPTDCV